MKFKLKVFINKANGQTSVHLPKNMLKQIPTEVEVKVDKQYIKKIMDKKLKW